MATQPRNIISPMGTGNGAYVLHKLLENRILGYQVIPYHPYRTLFPPSLLFIGQFHSQQSIFNYQFIPQSLAGAILLNQWSIDDHI
jgi:hypothetical protein